MRRRLRWFWVVFVSASLLSLVTITTQVKISRVRGNVNVNALEPFWNITRGSPRADEGWSVAVDDDGDVYFAGYDRISASTSDAFLYKLTPDAVELWNASWGGAYDEKAYIVTVKDGYVYVGGSTHSSFSLASADMFILKFHASNGSLVWSRTWNGSGNGYDEVDGLFVDGNSLYVAGWATETSTQTDIAILKYDVNGTFLWANTWGTSGVDEANGQIGVDENHIYVVGHYNALPLGIGGDAVLAAFNKTNGIYAWNVTWGGSGLDDAFGMTMNNEHIYSVGITNSFGGDMIFLLKYNKTGNLIWSRLWGGNSSEVARAIDINTHDASIYIAGNTMSYGQGDFDVVLLRYDQDGNLTLSKTWGGPELDQSHGIAVHDPFVYIAGETTNYGAGYEDAFLLKVDTEGGNTIPEFSPPTQPLVLLLATLCAAYLVLHTRQKIRNAKATG